MSPTRRQFAHPTATAAPALALAMVAALLAAGCDLLSDANGSSGGSGGGSGGGEIVDACRSYSDALARGDWPAACELLTGRQRQQWETVWQQALNDNRLVKSRSTVYGEPTVRGDAAVVNATTTTRYRQSSEATLGRINLTIVQQITLQRIGGQWKIAAIDTLEIQ